MLSRQDKMIEIQFDKVEHTGHTMEMVKKFEIELESYTDVIFGRKDSPVNEGISTMYEVSVAYYARAKEIEMFCKKLESGIDVGKTRHPIYKFRTGQLNVFIELVKELSKLGSRRITVAQMMLAENETDPL